MKYPFSGFHGLPAKFLISIKAFCSSLFLLYFTYYITNHYLLSLLICKIKFANVLYIVFIRLLNTIYCSAIILYLSFASSRNGCLSHSPKVHADNLEYEHTFILNNPRGSFPWDIYKFVSDSPHCLDIFFLCNLPQLLADIPDDTEHRTAYIHRLLLPD